MGTIANQTGVPLRNARLFYGTWAYRLGNLNAGEQVEVGEQLSPRHVKTIVTRDALGESGTTAVQVEGRVFSAEQASANDILNLMMFYETAGGFGFAHVPNRYQAYCDLSRQLDLGRALLVADAAAPARNWSIAEPGNRLATTSTIRRRLFTGLCCRYNGKEPLSVGGHAVSSEETLKLINSAWQPTLNIDAQHDRNSRPDEKIRRTVRDQVDRS